VPDGNEKLVRCKDLMAFISLLYLPETLFGL